MSYFRKQKAGLHLAYSHSGLDWTPLNNNKPVYSSTLKGHGSLMRDPYVAQGTDGLFHLVWTVDWRGRHIGHAESRDLIEWENARYLPVMADVGDCKNCWAPEFIYNEKTALYRILWASVAGGKKYQRMWSATTKDFKEISKPSVFFDPGFSCIDATIVKGDDEWYLVFKDERITFWKGFKSIRIATSKDIDGPYGNVSETVTPSPVEGPTVFKLKDKWVMFYEHYVRRRYRASVSKDFKSWRVMRPGPKFPDGARHGAVFTVSKQVFAPLKERFGKK